MGACRNCKDAGSLCVVTSLLLRYILVLSFAFLLDHWWTSRLRQINDGLASEMTERRPIDLYFRMVLWGPGAGVCGKHWSSTSKSFCPNSSRWRTYILS